MMAAAVTQTIVRELPTGTITVDIENVLMPFDSLFGFAARANAKRGFLFMSKVLGKHFPVKPSQMRRVHSLLAGQVPDELPQPIVFIAMAETAIGLGHGVFEQFCSDNPDAEAMFIHTTRYQLPESALIEFEEAHSHAPRQFLHLPQDPVQRQRFMSARSLVIVDDEASTGNTFVNLVRGCRELNPTIAEVHLSVITNFMGVEHSGEAYLSQRFGVPTTMGAALTGKYSFNPCAYDVPVHSSQKHSVDQLSGASPYFGRLGLSQPIFPAKSIIASVISQLDTADRILILGTGEFMHLPFVLALQLESLGYNVVVQSTTRSPILEWGAIEHKLCFSDNYNEGIDNFIYNVSRDQYDKIFVCHETPVNEAILTFATMLGATLLRINEVEIEQNPFC